MNQLPQERRPVGRVAGQEFVEKGGARPSEPGDHDGTPHDLVVDRRLLAPQLDEAQPVLEDKLQLRSSSDSASKVELSLVVKRRTETIQGFAKPVITDIFVTCSRTSGNQQIVSPQRHEGSTIVPQAPAECRQLFDPRSPLRGLP